MEITKEILAAILDAYVYEVIFVDRTHTVRYLNKAAKERYGDIVKVGASLFNCIMRAPRLKLKRSWSAPMPVKMKCSRS